MSHAIAQPIGWLKTLLIWPYFALVIAGLVVPSDGSHGFLNIKALAYVATVGSVGCYALIVQKIDRTQWGLVCFLALSFLFLLTWFGIAAIHEETPLNSAWDQWKIFWLTISFVVITAYLNKEGLVPFDKLLKTIIYANFAYSALKVIMVFLLVLGYFDVLALMTKLGFRFMSMDITGKIPRFQTSMDIATPFLLFFFLKGPRAGIHWSRGFRICYLFFSACAILLSFSRLLAFVGILSVFLHGFSTRNSMAVLVRSIALLVMSVSIGVAWIGIDESYAIVEKRLYSRANYISDLVRQRQIEALLEEHEQVPLLGKGLGSYAPNVIRDSQLKYSYEVQWVAFLMQFGVVGLLCILGAVGLIANKILSYPLTREKVCLFVLFLAWLAAGFTNPFLISLSSGILYSLFLLGGYAFSDRFAPNTDALQPFHNHQ